MVGSPIASLPIHFFERKPDMPWYFYLLEFVSGLFLTNGVPHFVQGVCGHRFQSPFASPPGVGESSPVSNALWGFGNWAVGFILLWFFGPQGSDAGVGWIFVGLGVLVTAVWMSLYFGKVRSKTN
jgi:hypothetical protein